MELRLTPEEQAFVQQYIETAEWVDPPVEGWYLNLSNVVRCPVWEREAIIDCLHFYSKYEVYLGAEDIEHAAHDLYLSRNGHGSGFWDNSDLRYPMDYAEKMQRTAEAMGEHKIQFEEE